METSRILQGRRVLASDHNPLPHLELGQRAFYITYPLMMRGIEHSILRGAGLNVLEPLELHRSAGFIHDARAS